MSMSPKKQIEQLKKSLPQIMLKDAFSARRKIQSIESRLNSSKPVEQPLVNLQETIDKSARQYLRREQNKPTTTYPEELPVSQKRDEIIQAIKQNQVIIICGETGSGKTTQLPKMCLDAGLGRKIGIRRFHGSENSPPFYGYEAKSGDSPKPHS